MTRTDQSGDPTPVRLERREWIGIISGIALPSFVMLITLAVAWTTMKNSVDQNTKNHNELAIEVGKWDSDFTGFREEIRSNHKETIEAISRLAERVRYLEAKVE